MFEENVIETESHFLLYCNKYNQLRFQFCTNLNALFTLYTNFDSSDDEFKLTLLMSNEYGKSTAKFIWECFIMKHRHMYIMVNMILDLEKMYSFV